MDRQKLSIGLILIAVSCGGAYILFRSLGGTTLTGIDFQRLWASLPVGTRLIAVGLFIANTYGLGMVLQELLSAGRRTGDRG
jgi:hypothetical protein